MCFGERLTGTAQNADQFDQHDLALKFGKARRLTGLIHKFQVGVFTADPRWPGISKHHRVRIAQEHEAKRSDFSELANGPVDNRDGKLGECQFFES
jgi:hypothetical protein